MSGHSKWHNIQKTKGAADAKRSAAFTKSAKEIIVAVKQGGSGDPANNSRLATVIAKAKANNMPNDNIKRTIDKALGSGNTDNYESVTCWTSTARAWVPPAACPGPSTARASSSSRRKTWTRIPS